LFCRLLLTTFYSRNVFYSIILIIYFSWISPSNYVHVIQLTNYQKWHFDLHSIELSLRFTKSSKQWNNIPHSLLLIPFTVIPIYFPQTYTIFHSCLVELFHLETLRKPQTNQKLLKIKVEKLPMIPQSSTSKSRFLQRLCRHFQVFCEEFKSYSTNSLLKFQEIKPFSTRQNTKLVIKAKTPKSSSLHKRSSLNFILTIFIRWQTCGKRRRLFKAFVSLCEDVAQEKLN
jgi:hypothetical protein